MKLRGKIQLLFGGTVFILMFVVGMITFYSSRNTTQTMISDNMESSASLLSSHIEDKLKDYMNIATVAGRDDVISGRVSKQEKLELLQYYVNTYGFTSANILNKNGVSIEDGTDFSDREYVVKALQGEVNVSDITLSKYTNTYGISIAAPIYNAKEVITGVVYFRVDINFLLNVIEKELVSENSYAYIVNKSGDIVVHPDQSKILQNNISEQSSELAKILADYGKLENGNYVYEYEGEEMYCGYSPIANTSGWSVILTAPAEDFSDSINAIIEAIVMVDIIVIILTLLIAASLAGYISKPIRQVKDIMVAIRQGDFSVKISSTARKDELGILQNTAGELLDTLTGVVQEANTILAGIVNYDLRTENMKSYPGKFDELATSVNTIKEMLTGLIVEVQDSAMNVENGSRQLVSATSALSNGTLAQANSIQKLMEDMGDVAQNIENSTNNGIVVNEKLIELEKQIKLNNEDMTELRQVVLEIEEMSEDIQKIVNTIDSIAFQTNILALNASVEAARAGENGKGFAVVAEEVGSLAAKCGEASKRTAELIDKCITSISNAKGCADNTFEGLAKIVKNSEEISDAFGQIAEDNMKQSEYSVTVKGEITNISDVVQSNTATAEETAASTEVLSQQAWKLGQMVQQFKVRRSEMNYPDIYQN